MGYFFSGILALATRFQLVRWVALFSGARPGIVRWVPLFELASHSEMGYFCFYSGILALAAAVLDGWSILGLALA